MELRVPDNLLRVLVASGADNTDELCLSQEDLEWLFFGALFHQFAFFGGRSPVLDLTDESRENYEESGELDLTDFEAISWPPLPALGLDETALGLDEMRPFFQIFAKYQEEPWLWSAGILYEEGEYLSLDVESRVELGPLQERDVRQALIARIDSQDWGPLRLIAEETSRMLGDTQIFRLPGEPE